MMLNTRTPTALKIALVIAGLVLIDVDFYDDNSGLVQAFERVPWLGTAMTNAFEVSGAFSDSSRHPYCEEGGHCLTLQQARVRDLGATLAEHLGLPPGAHGTSRLRGRG